VTLLHQSAPPTPKKSIKSILIFAKKKNGFLCQAPRRVRKFERLIVQK
jgi:hypothetical protein